MAIGTAAAIGLGVAGIGAALGARSSSKAAGKAADTSLAVAQQNNALARDIYGQNKQALDPYAQRGNKAGDALNALLGLGGPEPQQQQQQPFQQANPFAQFSRSQLQDIGFNSFNPANFSFPNQQSPQPVNVPQGPTAQEAQESAFDTFRNSTGYQFRLDEGNKALNSQFAGSGVLRSGAAAKAALEFGQNTASNEFGNYAGLLANQQGVGLSGASALAGVGQNFANSVSANNTNAGNAAANAALIKGQNNPFASLLGTVGGFASSYGGR